MEKVGIVIFVFGSGINVLWLIEYFKDYFIIFISCFVFNNLLVVVIEKVVVVGVEILFFFNVEFEIFD